MSVHIRHLSPVAVPGTGGQEWVWIYNLSQAHPGLGRSDSASAQSQGSLLPSAVRCSFSFQVLPPRLRKVDQETQSSCHGYLINLILQAREDLDGMR